MANLLFKKPALFSPKTWIQSVRHRGKFNSRYPRPRHDIGRFLEEVTKPILLRKMPDPVESCCNSKSFYERKFKTTTKTASEFEVFLAKLASNLFSKNNVLVVCHRHYCSNDLIRLNKIEFRKNNIELWNFNTITMRLFIEQNPMFENLLPIINNALGRNVYLFTKEATNLNKLIQLLRKMPHLVMIGGLVDNTLLTRTSVQDFVKLDDINMLREQLCTILNQSALLSVTNIEHQINVLSKSLESINKTN